MVGELPDFPSMKRMLDIGGGPGIIAMAIIDSHPSMTGVVLELPGMARVAENLVREYGMERRIEVVSGDFLRSPVGEGYDLIWCSFCLYFGKHCLDKVVRKMADALVPGGVFISLHEGLTDEKTSPEMLVLPQLAQNMMGHPVAFVEGEIADALRRAGFSSVNSRPEESPYGQVELVVGRK